MANTISNEAQVMLRMHDIHKSFGDLAVLKGIDVENLPLEEIIRQSLKRMVK